jgi:mannose/fructose-specific phosphotransferase system component IIA
MRKFLIASHGTFASGIKSSLEIIAGNCDQVFTIDAYMSEKITIIEEEMDTVLHQLAKDDELIIFTDLAGGSVTNRILMKSQQSNIHLVAGLNLPLLVEVVMAEPNIPIAEVLVTAITNAKEQIIDVKQWMAANQEITD